MKRILLLTAILSIMALSGCKGGAGNMKDSSEKGVGQVFIRYNYLGYTPARQKRLVIMATEEIKGNPWTLTNTTTGMVKQSGTFDASVFDKGAHLPLDFNYVIDISTVKELGAYTFVTPGADTATFEISEDPYSWLIQEPLHWLRAARCGDEHTVDHGVCHLGDKSCVIHRRKGGDNGSWHADPKLKRQRIDGSGGWHDAADYLKFSLTIGYTTYFLLRSYDVNPELFDTMKIQSQTEYNDLIDEAKVGLDWLMKAMPNNKQFIVMIGDSEDHNVGYRLPDVDELDGHRPALSALSPPQMGYAAASLALGASIFKDLGKDALAKKYGKMADKIYRVAVSSAAEPMGALNDATNVFYGDETKNDNLELAAAELYRWTGNEYYKKEAIKYADLARASGWKAWESVNMAAHMSIMDFYPVAKNDIYMDLDGFLENGRRKGNLWGVPMKYVWGGLYSYIGVGAAAMEYGIRSGERKYDELGRNMLDYLLGYNNWGISFVATEDPRLLGKTITDPYSQVYNLQADKFPRGAISEGPGDRQSWEKFAHYFGFDTKAERTDMFNTSEGVFYDKRNDFMCMETTIVGISDGIFLLALADKYFKDQSK